MTFSAPQPAIPNDILEKENDEQQVRSGVDAVDRQQSDQVAGDCFRGDTDQLVASVGALLTLDEDGALVPHGIGGHARGLLRACVARLRAQPAIPDGWQPIETAPRGENNEFLAWDGQSIDKSWKGWDIDGNPVYVRSDWISWNPTHWMPLPAAPETRK